MKTILLAISLVCANAAFGQNAAVLSSQPQIFQIPDHPNHARTHVMAEEQNLRGNDSPYTYAKGELPLSDFARASASIPLGDVARSFREERASTRKAKIVWAN